MNDLLSEIAEIKKQEWLKLVDLLARFRDAQYETDLADSMQSRAEKIIAINLPSNLLRAAAIFVDHAHGFPPGKGTFEPPEWVLSREILPEEKRGLLSCRGFKDTSEVEEGDCVVLCDDLPDRGLHAGMAGIVKELMGDENQETILVEFGEPQVSTTVEAEVPKCLLRTPRPGDLLEAFRR
jgi:hypothetical protein